MTLTGRDFLECTCESCDFEVAGGLGLERGFGDLERRLARGWQSSSARTGSRPRRALRNWRGAGRQLEHGLLLKGKVRSQRKPARSHSLPSRRRKPSLRTALHPCSLHDLLLLLHFQGAPSSHPIASLLEPRRRHVLTPSPAPRTVRPARGLLPHAWLLRERNARILLFQRIRAIKWIGAGHPSDRQHRSLRLLNLLNRAIHSVAGHGPRPVLSEDD